MVKPTLSSVQSVVGLLAGLFSVIGGVYTGVQYLSRSSGSGELVAVVHDARSDRPVRGSSVEVLGADDALVTTLAAGDGGRARARLREGTYRVRVTHPRYAPDMRRVQVAAGQSAELRVRLTPRPGGAPAIVAETTRAVHEGAGTVRRFFESLVR